MLDLLVQQVTFINKILEIMGFDPQVDRVIGSGYIEQDIRELCKEYVKNQSLSISDKKALSKMLSRRNHYIRHYACAWCGKNDAPSGVKCKECQETNNE
jgi:hypothetical protein